MNIRVQEPAKPPAPDPQWKLRLPNKRLLIGGVLAALALSLLFAAYKIAPVVGSRARSVGSTTVAPQPTQSPASQSVESFNAVVEDDGKTLWVSPTESGPLDLAYLAPGAQIIVAVRPADIRRHAEGEKVLQALGPIGQQIAHSWEQLIPWSPREIERLVIGCQPTSDGKWLNTIVVHSAQAIASEQILANLPNAAKSTYKESTFYSAGGVAYFLPSQGTKNILVATPDELISDIIDLGGQPPALRRDIERLLSSTDSTRQFTVVLAPNALFSEGQYLFAGELAPLRNALFWFLGDELSGAALSLHWDADFFIEVIAVPTLETSAEKAARILDDRVHQMPESLEAYVGRLNPQPFGRQVVVRFPQMVGKLAGFTRTGYEKDRAVLRSYLPAVAGHNLLMAGELMLAEASGGAALVAEATAPTSAQHANATSAKSGLNKVTSLKFARDTLESALEQLSQDVGVPIVIRGADLQADGITKNQSFGIDLSDKPAAEILVEILRLANPDKAATGPRDPRQKLVYVLGQAPDKTVQIVVTTRARAAERGDELPAVFQAEKP